MIANSSDETYYLLSLIACIKDAFQNVLFEVKVHCLAFHCTHSGNFAYFLHLNLAVILHFK